MKAKKKRKYTRRAPSMPNALLHNLLTDYFRVNTTLAGMNAIRADLTAQINAAMPDSAT